jgi:hypothetical protein
MSMRGTLARAACAAVLWLAAAGAGQAEIEYPYCSRGSSGNYGSGAVNCSFVSMAQCEASARGNGEWCQVNPAYVAPRGEAPAAAHGQRARRPAR